MNTSLLRKIFLSHSPNLPPRKKAPGVPAVAQQDWQHLSSARTQAQSPAWHSGLKNPLHLWHIGCNCSLDLIPGPGAPYAQGDQKRKRKKETKKQNKPSNPPHLKNTVISVRKTISVEHNLLVDMKLFQFPMLFSHKVLFILRVSN